MIRVSPWLVMCGQNDLNVCEVFELERSDINHFCMALKTQKSSG